MLYLVDSKGCYSPEVITVMAAAFDRVCQFLPKSVNSNDEARQQCAWNIIRLVDQGQHDPQLLFKLTLKDLTGAKLSCPAPEHPRATA